MAAGTAAANRTVDVGANEGRFTAAAAYLVKLQGVHAFEPQSNSHQELQRVLATVPNGRLHSAAVGVRQGETELLCTVNSKMASVFGAGTVGGRWISSG